MSGFRGTIRAVLLADVVAASAAVAGTRSRKAKIETLAAVLRRAAPDEIEPVTAWLAGAARQGRIGTGWRTLSSADAAPAAVATLTPTDVDATLDELAVTTGAGSAARRRALLSALFSAATADEQRFLRALIGGELRQGALEGVMLDAIAVAAQVPQDAARRAFMLSGRLPATAIAALTGGEPALRAIGLELGRPIRPMLASPADTLDDALAELGPDVLVDHKLDGARVQLHRDGSQVAVFTRSLRDITAGVPELVELARALPGLRMVLDGEALSIDDDGRPLLFQDSMSSFGTGTQRAYFFDCLHLDGTDLIDEPLATRLDALDQAAGAYRMPGVLRPDPAAAAELLDSALEEGHEGVMVKSLGAPYAAGRRGRAWLKVKPVHTLDLVVLGAEWGYGRRTGYLSNIHLGARDPSAGGAGKSRSCGGILRHGRQDVQGDDRRAARLADRDVPDGAAR